MSEVKSKPKQKRRGRNEGSVFQRADGLWVGRVDFGYDVAGKRQRKTVYAKTRKEVHEKLQEELAKRSGGLHNPTQATVTDWVTKYLDDAKSRLRPRTIRNYESAAKVHVYPAIDNLKLSKVKPIHIDRIYRGLEKVGKHGAACTVAKVLKPSFLKAKRLGMIAFNPVAEVDNPSETDVNSKTWTPDEAETFLQAIKEHRDYALYHFAIMTGMRIGELCALRWEHVRLNESQLDVRYTLGFNAANLLGPPKTKSSERTITLSQSAVDAVHERRAQNLRATAVRRGCSAV
jgi:integrase